MYKNYVILVLIATILGGTLAYLSRPTTQTTPPVGSVSSNQPLDPFYFQGGLTSQVKQFVSTTTVACMIQNPTNATTTFAMVGWTVPTATTTTTVLDIATTTNASRFATTTALVSKSLAAAKGTATYRPTSNNDILGPTDWIIVGYGSGTTLPTVAQQQSGFCSAVFNILR